MSYEMRIIYWSSDFFFFKHKTAYELRISDGSSDVCSSDLVLEKVSEAYHQNKSAIAQNVKMLVGGLRNMAKPQSRDRLDLSNDRSEEHTSELQSLMRISYAVFCLTNRTRVSEPKATASQYVRNQGC